MAQQAAAGTLGPPHQAPLKLKADCHLGSAIYHVVQKSPIVVVETQGAVAQLRKDASAELESKRTFRLPHEFTPDAKPADISASG